MGRPKKPKAEKVVALAIYLPPGVLNRMRRLAEQEHRSMSAQALLFLERALEEE